MKLYEAIAEAFIAEGVGAVFGLMGDGNMPFWAALAQGGRIPIYSARHEAAAVGMADGYFRATGAVSVATTTWGPGLTQAATPLVVAARNRSGVVLAVGAQGREALDRTQYLDHKRFAELCGADWHEITSPDAAPRQLAEAFYAARVLRRTVLLNIPVDLQFQELTWDWDYTPSTAYQPAPAALEPDPAGIALLHRRLAAAERPVIVAGRGARAAGARAAILALADRAGALLATTLPAKGYFSDQDWDIGISGAFATAPAEALFAEADFVLGIGAELGHFTTEGGLLYPSAEIARIDTAEAPPAIGALPGLWLRADARRAAEALVARFDAAGPARTGYRTPATRQVLDTPPPPPEAPNDGLDPRRVLQNLSRALPANARIVSGVGHYWGFVAMYLALPPNVDQVLSYQFGSIGQALIQALGIAAARDGRTNILIEGDGSLLVHVQEIETAVRHDLPLVILVMNDQGFGAEVHKLRAKGFDGEAARWPELDFVAIARAFGAQGRVLAHEDGIGPALADAVAAGGVHVIDARISPSTVTDTYGKLHFGRPNRAPLLRAALIGPVLEGGA